MDALLQDYLKQADANCPNCGHSLSVHSHCEGCGDRLYLVLKDARLCSTVLSRKWCLVFIPWFLFCFGAANDWTSRMFGILLHNQDFSIYYLPASADPIVIVFWFTAWLTWFAPLICLYLWIDRRRINRWPAWAIWLGFGIAGFIWAWDLTFTIRTLL